MKLDIVPKVNKGPQTVSQGFSLSAEQKKKVEQLAQHYRSNMSKVVQALIDAHHKEVFTPKRRSK